MEELQVIEDPAAAGVTLDPVRSRLLAALVEPGSATTLASELGLSRQKVNYHVRALEEHGLLELVEERRKGNMTERVLQATASSYVISPAALAAVAPHPSAMTPDQFSARWLIALAARLIRDVGTLLVRAAAMRQPLATFAVDSEIRFATAGDRAAFARELAGALEQLAARYHAPDAPMGRSHRVVLALHPCITKTEIEARAEQAAAINQEHTS